MGDAYTSVKVILFFYFFVSYKYHSFTSLIIFWNSILLIISLSTYTLTIKSKINLHTVIFNYIYNCIYHLLVILPQKSSKSMGNIMVSESIFSIVFVLFLLSPCSRQMYKYTLLHVNASITFLYTPAHFKYLYLFISRYILERYVHLISFYFTFTFILLFKFVFKKYKLYLFLYQIIEYQFHLYYNHFNLIRLSIH